MPDKRATRAFTLVELLVIMAIIAVLIGVLLPALSRARDASYRLSCSSNIRQFGIYLRMYASMQRDYVPIGFTYGDEWANYNFYNGDPKPTYDPLSNSTTSTGWIAIWNKFDQ